jgi:mannose-6-phosphate isomerase-like protein (cupin superfamily)
MDRAVVVNTAALDVEQWDDQARGSVSWRTIFSGGRTPTSGLTVGLAELAPQVDDSIGNPMHHHAPPEIYYILEGEGVVIIDGESHDVGPGSAVFIPGDAEHSLANCGTTTLRLLYAFSADSFDDITYVFDT